MEASSSKRSRRGKTSGQYVIGPSRREKRLHDHEGAASHILRALGTVFVVLGLFELLLLWIPPQLGNAAWEFATISRSLDAMPMLALGMAVLGYTTVGGQFAETSRVRLLALAFAVAVVLVVVLAGLYATVVPAVVSNTPPEAMDGVQRALVKGVVQLVAYFSFFVAVVLSLWKRLTWSA
jgi:uncharacterized protein YjeT (DUF2065 family)